MLNLAIRHFYLTIGLWMVRDQQSVGNPKFYYQGLSRPVAEMGPIITNNDFEDIVLREDCSVKKLNNHIAVACLSWYGLGPFSHIIYCDQNIQIPI